MKCLIGSRRTNYLLCIKLLVVLVTLLNTPVLANTYYVATNGNDANDGTAAHPWKTINNGDVKNLLSGGDTVIVTTGTYTPADANGIVISKCGGTLLNPITYTTSGAVKVDATSFNSGVNYGFKVTKGSNVIDGFEVLGAVWGVYIGTDSPTDFYSTVSNCKIHDGNANMVSAGVFINLANYCTVANNVIYNYNSPNNYTWDPRGTGVSACGSAGTKVVNNTINNCFSGVFFYPQAGGYFGSITTRNNIITNCKSTNPAHPEWGWGLVNPWSTDVSQFVCSNNLLFNNSIAYGNFPAGNNAPFPSDVTADPKYVNAAAGDFHLRAGSPAIDAGVIVGLPFGGSAPDMGAYEYEYTPPTTVNVTNLGTIKSLSVGSLVNIITAKVATSGSFTFADGSYHIEDSGRSAAVRVIPYPDAPTVYLGDNVTLKGLLDIDANGQRFIKALSIVKSSGIPLGPLGISCKSALATTGLDPSGLLIKTWGQVISRASDGSSIYINERNNPGEGLRVVLGGLNAPISQFPMVGETCTITGIAGLANDGTAVTRAIYPRADTDINRILTVPAQSGQQLFQSYTDNWFGSDTSLLPFSFNYGGISSTELLWQWDYSSSSQVLDSNRTQFTHTYTDPVTQLQLQCVATQYQDYPAIEWVLYFTNNGSADTPILSSILPLNTTLTSNSVGNPTLYYANGCNMSSADFQSHQTTITRTVTTIAPNGGRSSSCTMPFFNLAQTDGSGAMIGVGWSGQWAANFACVGYINPFEQEVSVQAGMQYANFKLHPGERVRTPAALVMFWSGGDRVKGQNNFRRLLLNHYSPTPGGQPVELPICASPHGVYGLVDTTASNMIQGIDNVAANNLGADVWWIDAGWYPVWPMSGVAPWNTIGTWIADPVRYPNGLKPVADEAHSKGMKLLLWFEMERAMAGSQIATDHPDWLLTHGTLPPGFDYEEQFMLFNLGNPAALAWAKTYFSQMIQNVGIDIYRIDFNMDPLYCWQNGEAADRQGINETKYIMGWYDFLDTLLQENPNLMIDNCAGGGRRLDFEMLRRSSAMTRDDLGGTVEAQSQTLGLSQWVPMTGGVAGSTDSYSSRSAWGSSFGMIFDWYNNPAVWTPAKQMLSQYKAVKNLFTGDFYPLTEFSTGTDSWVAWQYDRSDLGDGMLQAFRRPGNTRGSMTFFLRGLIVGGNYLVTDLDKPTWQVQMTGAQLMHNGLEVSIGPGSSAVLRYHRIN